MKECIQVHAKTWFFPCIHICSRWIKIERIFFNIVKFYSQNEKKKKGSKQWEMRTSGIGSHQKFDYRFYFFAREIIKRIYEEDIRFNLHEKSLKSIFLLYSFYGWIQLQVELVLNGYYSIKCRSWWSFCCLDCFEIHKAQNQPRISKINQSKTFHSILLHSSINSRLSSNDYL